MLFQKEQKQDFIEQGINSNFTDTYYLPKITIKYKQVFVIF